MKRSFLFKVMCPIGALAMVFACEKVSAGDENYGTGTDTGEEDDEPIVYTLSVNPTELNFACRASDASQTFTVTTNVPEGFTLSKSDKWYTVSQDGDEVTVTVEDNEGDARSHELVVSAEGVEPVTVTISQDKYVAPSLSGEKYIVWFLDAASREELGDKIIADLSIFNFDIYNNNDIWKPTFVVDDPDDLGFYGQTGDYMALRANEAWWSGAAYGYKLPSEDPDALDLSLIWKQITDVGGEDWYFHIAVKGDGTSNSFRLCDKDDVDNKSFNLNLSDVEGYNPDTWTEVEIPMTEVIASGWRTGALSGYTLTIGGGGGTERNHYDALFIYKK